jgi:recombination protein RecR
MQKRVTGPEIERLIQLLARVPGLGPRSARRAALHLIKKKDQLMGPLALAMNEAFDKVRICSTCGNADTSDPCTVCTDPSVATRASSSSSRTSPISGRWNALRR